MRESREINNTDAVGLTTKFSRRLAAFGVSCQAAQIFPEASDKFESADCVCYGSFARQNFVLSRGKQFLAWRCSFLPAPSLFWNRRVGWQELSSEYFLSCLSSRGH